MNNHKITVLAAALCLFGCGPGFRDANYGGLDSNGAFQIDANQCFELGLALEKVGNHLEAGIYFDAALRYGGDEATILPRLVAAQVRSGQLRAARKNVRRLAEIERDEPRVEELGALLAKLIPPGDAVSSEEVAR